MPRNTIILFNKSSESSPLFFLCRVIWKKSSVNQVGRNSESKQNPFARKEYKISDFLTPFCQHGCKFFLELVTIYSWKDYYRSPFSPSSGVKCIGSKSQHSCQEVYFSELWMFVKCIIVAWNLMTSISLLSLSVFDKLITLNNLIEWAVRMLSFLGRRPGTFGSNDYWNIWSHYLKSFKGKWHYQEVNALKTGLLWIQKSYF